ncbi:transcriptional regulator [Salmonella enterica subsp. salamae]|nr:transcriptional regulator [Salmonella enterica]ECJ5918314.1 transcriptional regulator [Salmonella enterica subsp. salamae]EAX8554708.1 transcriptional regulator [Salmonella enterica]EAX8595002.1 transcriptional regulator [Salmonella enterica]EAX8617074.1 transcriptional regulator [Salmonella enterica]
MPAQYRIRATTRTSLLSPLMQRDLFNYENPALTSSTLANSLPRRRPKEEKLIAEA